MPNVLFGPVHIIVLFWTGPKRTDSYVATVLRSQPVGRAVAGGGGHVDVPRAGLENTLTHEIN